MTLRIFKARAGRLSRLRRLYARISAVTIYAKQYCLYMAFGALLACLPGAAESAASAPENRQDTVAPRRFETSFVSLKQGHSIAPAIAQLSDNGTFALSIPNELLSDAQGRYAIAGMRFEADYAFAMQRLPDCRYVLSLKGIMLFNTYIVGTAGLKEFVAADRLTQEIPFFFIATAEGAARERQPRRRPFF